MAEAEIKKINGRTIADTTAREAAKDSIKYTEQTLTDAQKAQAISNIGAVAKLQGSANSGKFLTVGADGNVSANGSPTFHVTISKENNANVSDKTVAEIKAAYQSGRSVVADIDGLILPLLSVSDEFVAFCALTPDDEMQRVGVIVTNTGVAFASDFFVGGNQGVDNSGKILGIDPSGNVVPEDKPTFTLTEDEKTEIAGEVVADGVEVVEKEIPVQALAGATAPTTSTVGVIGQEYYVIADNTVTEMYVCTSIADGAYTWDKVEFGGDYTLPTASSTTLGGVKPIAKTDVMTQGVGVDDAGALWTAAGGGSRETWELIRDLTLDEPVNMVEISTDTAGQSISLLKIKVYAVIKTYFDDHLTTLKFTLNNKTVTGNSTVSASSKKETLYYAGYAEVDDEFGVTIWITPNMEYNRAVSRTGFITLKQSFSETAITSVKVMANDGGKPIGDAGTNIKIYGVRA